MSETREPAWAMTVAPAILDSYTESFVVTVPKSVQLLINGVPVESGATAYPGDTISAQIFVPSD